MSEEIIRIGLIGAGQNTRKMHIPKLKILPGVEILEVANRSRESGQKVADEFGIPHVKNNWREVAESDDLDAVVIGTWPYLHCEATCLALESGKHVLCEARMAMNEAEARTMLQAALAHPELTAQLVPAPFTFHADRTIRDFLAGEKLGRLLYFHLDYQSSPLVPPGGPLHWRRNIKYSGLNAMVLGIVYESLLRWLPPAEWVCAMGKVFNDSAFDPETGKPTVVEIPDYLAVQMRLTNGMPGSMLISETGLYAATPTVQIFGDRGTLKLEFVSEGKLWTSSQEDGPLKEVEIAEENRGRWRVEEEFINSIRGKEEVKFTTFADGVEYMKFTEAVMRNLLAAGATGK